MTTPATPIAATPIIKQTRVLPEAARSARRTELWLLLLGMMLVAAYLAAVEANMLETVSSDFWAPAGVLTAVFRALHVVIRLRAPFADPVLMAEAGLPTESEQSGGFRDFSAVAIQRRHDVGYRLAQLKLRKLFEAHELLPVDH